MKKYLMFAGLFASISTPALADEVPQAVSRTPAATTAHCSAMSSADFTKAVA
jgi:hypothetical protein